MNNRLAVLLIALFSLVFISACQTSPSATNVQNDPDYPSEALIKDCSAKGGKYIKQGKLQRYKCVTYFSDAGKSCSDSSECQGSCLNSNRLIETNTSNIVGQCASTDSPFGCREIVENGVGKGFLCID